MTKDYGARISKPGFDVKTANPEELAFSSKYGTLKISARGSGTLTNAARTVTIPHGLGYVPFFLVHTQPDAAVATNAVVGDNTDFFINPFRLAGAVSIFEDENTHDIVAWADSTNLYIKARDNVGKQIYPIAPAPSADLDEQIAFEDDHGYTHGEWFVGNVATGGHNVEDGAVRINGSLDLDKEETIFSATLSLLVSKRNGTNEVKMNIYGIDEDNTGAFNAGTAATARTKTTAVTAHNTTVSQGEFAGADVKDQVEEIVARSGWSNGNKIGFIMTDNGTVADSDYGEDAASGVGSFLEIMKSSDLVDYKYTIFLNQLA